MGNVSNHTPFPGAFCSFRPAGEGEGRGEMLPLGKHLFSEY